MELKIIATGCTAQERAQKRWGISLLVDNTVLFDTFGDPDVFRANLEKYSVNYSLIEQVVISHDHWDHVAGLPLILRDCKGVIVHCCRDISPQTEQHAISGSSSVVFASDSSFIKDGIWTSGQFECMYDGALLHEQALVIERPQGLVVAVGCSHPGIQTMLERISREFKEPVYMVIGGLHLKDSSEKELDGVAGFFRKMGVKKIAPTHCTGAAAVDLLRKKYGTDFIEVREGLTIEV